MEDNAAAAATAAAAAAAAKPEDPQARSAPSDEDEEDLVPEILLKDLVILPPRQKANSAMTGLILPPLRSEEPVQSLRAALTEVVGYAHLTNFRFELENSDVVCNKTNGQSGDTPPTTRTNKSTTSPTGTTGQSPLWTGKDAVIAVPAQCCDSDGSDSIAVLDEYGDLTPLLDRGLCDGAGFRIVLERYDAASVKDHVGRLRSLLDGNAPTVTSLVEDVNVPTSTTNADAADNKEEEEVAPQEETVEASEPQKDDTKPPKKPSLLPELKQTNETVVVDGSNLADFFYLAFGEDRKELHYTDTDTKDSNSKQLLSKKKKRGKKELASVAATATSSAFTTTEDNSEIVDETQLIREKTPRWNQLEELARVQCTIQYSGYHPPPPQRRWMGDIAYFCVTLNTGTSWHVTATTMGFYVNRSTQSTFDPSPAAEPHFSHALLDCLLEASLQFRDAWTVALDACQERAEITTLLNRASPFSSLFRAAIRGDFDGFSSAATAAQVTSEALDASLLTPSWLAPLPRTTDKQHNDWARHQCHSHSPHRAEDELQTTFGVEIRSGAVRDWNEELQLAREMPTDSLPERMERARLVHKVMTEFGEASLLGVKAISEGQIAPMNPNEATRSQVYLHNNIFFSRGVDAGPETFKIAKGDKAARKSSNRDIQCIGTFHRMEKSGLYTLATVLIDYLGTRFVCQSILPGILIGEKSHTLLYGAVETGIPLKWDEELHKILEDKVGEGMMVATRPILKNPLTQERMQEIKLQKKATPLFAETEKKIEEAQEGMDPNAVINTCVPVEAKGILGSDQRKYVLDLSRLTPCDANWVPEERGGTGKFEALLNKESSGNKSSTEKIPLALEDDEWTMSVLRPELVSRFTQVRMAKHMQAKKKIEEEKTKQEEEKTAKDKNVETEEKDSSKVETTADNSESGETTNAKKEGDDNESEPEPSKLTKEDLDHLESLKLNLNVFLPHMRSFEGIDEEAAAQVKADEQLAKEVAEFLWDDVLPKITRAIKDGAVHQLPVDGRTLTEFLHRNGVNCRYLGRLATLAKEQEEKDVKTEADLKLGKLTVIERKTMPKCWLELIECEMVARAAKHVLDDYLTANGGVAASQPAQTVASFLSALVSEAEETAAQTETRMEKRSSLQPDDDEVGALTITDIGGDGDAVPPPIRSRYEVWQDIESEIGRRFRYSLSLFNKGNKSNRALYIPLLRRVCHRTGVRLFAKKYDLGGKCLCGGSSTFCGRLTPSYPISPLDIADIVPLMKHSAAYSEGFTPCTMGATIGLPPLQVSLQDARATLERAHIQAGGRALGKGLELAQEAGALYQRVTENAAHPGVIESIELMATIFLEAGDPVNAAANGAKALGLTIQSSGFDSAASFNAHMSLFQMLFTAHEMERAVKHLRAAIYLLEIMGGPRHIEHYTAYHKLGSVYSHADYNGKYLSTALECFREAKNRDSCDRLMDGFMAKNFAKVLTGLENYKDALEYEKRAFRTLSMFLGKDHQMTLESDAALNGLTKLAVDKGNRKEANDKMREESAKADSIAADLAAEEDKKKKKNSKNKKRGKK